MQAVLALKRPEPRAGVLEIEPYVRTLFAAPRRRQFLFIGDGVFQMTPVATPTFGVRADDHFVTVSAPITLWAQILFRQAHHDCAYLERTGRRLRRIEHERDTID